MEPIRLVPVSEEYAGAIAEYAAQFPAERMRVTLKPDRIPGLDGLEECADVRSWLGSCAEMAGKISWFLSVRERDGKVVGALVLRHSLEYDDDDPEFASHFGYSIRPDEQRKGYAKEQLRLGLEEARKLGLTSVRLVCRDLNIGSGRTIRSCGGVYLDSITGEESGMRIDRYDIAL